METRAKARLAAKLAEDKKAEEIVILDMRKVANFCDYFVICSGTSERQVDAIRDAVEEGFLEKKLKQVHSNFPKNGMWSLLDYGDIVIHIFHQDVRKYYNLERLWIDAPRVPFHKN